MPLAEPPQAAGSLADLPSPPLRNRTLYRVSRAHGPDGQPRSDAWWWFASVPDEPDEGGRYDLPAPMGTCYTGTSRAAALFEALQAHLTLLPRDELAIRRMSALFDQAGAHPPSHGSEWTVTTTTLHDDPEVEAELSGYGIEVHDPGDLPFTSP